MSNVCKARFRLPTTEEFDIFNLSISELTTYAQLQYLVCIRSHGFTSQGYTSVVSPTDALMGNTSLPNLIEQAI